MTETFRHTDCLFTEREAARKAKPGAHKQAMVVLAAIRGAGTLGLTIEEVATFTGLRQSSVCARRKWLEDMGMIVDSGKRRKTTSGRMAVVWEVVR